MGAYGKHNKSHNKLKSQELIFCCYENDRLYFDNMPPNNALTIRIVEVITSLVFIESWFAKIDLRLTYVEPTIGSPLGISQIGVLTNPCRY